MQTDSEPQFSRALNTKTMPSYQLMDQVKDYLFNKFQSSVKKMNGNPKLLDELDKNLPGRAGTDVEPMLFASTMEKIYESIPKQTTECINNRKTLIRWMELYRLNRHIQFKSVPASYYLYNIIEDHLEHEKEYNMNNFLKKVFRAAQTIDYFEEESDLFNSMAHYLLFSFTEINPKYIMDKKPNQAGVEILATLEMIHCQNIYKCSKEFKINSKYKTELIKIGEHNDKDHLSRQARTIMVLMSALTDMDELLYDPPENK